MIWTSPSRRRRTEARPRHAMMAAQSALIIGRLGCVTQNTNRSFEFPLACSRGLRRAFPARSSQRDRRDHENRALRPIACRRWPTPSSPSSLAPSALAALGSFVPDQALSALRSLIPGETPFLQLLLLGSIGVGLGRLTIKADAESRPRAAAKPKRAARDGRQGRKGRPGSAPGGKGAAGPFDRQRKLFRATRRPQPAPVAA